MTDNTDTLIKNLIERVNTDSYRISKLEIKEPNFPDITPSDGILDILGDLRVYDTSTNLTWVTPGTIAFKALNNSPLFSFHNNVGTRLGYIQANTTTGIIIADENNKGIKFVTNSTESFQMTNAGQLFVYGSSTNATFTTSGTIALKNGDNVPIITFHRDTGVRQGSIQFREGDSVGLRIASELSIQPVTIATNSIERMRITQTGDVGVGHTVPDSLLHVNGVVIFGDTAISANKKLRFVSDLSSISYIQVGSSSSDISANLRIVRYSSATSTINLVEIYANNTYISGNLGVGTATPGQQLVVSSTSPYLRLRNTKTGNNNDGDDFSGIEFYSDDPDMPGLPGVQAYIKASHVRAGTGHTFADAGINFGTRNTSGTLAIRMTVDHDGNVGIGTTKPTSKLDIIGSFQVYGASTNSTFTSGGQIALKTSPDRPYISYHRDSGVRQGYIQYREDDGPGFRIASDLAAQPITIFTNSIERVRITQAGDVGIGHTAPDSLLHVNGIVILGVNAASAGKKIRFVPDTSNISYIQVGASNSDTAANLRIVRYSSATSTINLVEIYANNTYISGNLGIGTASPSGIFETSTSNEELARFTRTGATASGTVRILRTANTLGTSSDGFVLESPANVFFSSVGLGSWYFVNNSGTARAILNSIGRLGIGNLDPQATVDTSGDIFIRQGSSNTTFTASGALAIKRVTSNPFISFHHNDGTRQGWIQSNGGTQFTITQQENLPMVLQTNNTRALRISAGGYVSVGSDTETQPFYVRNSVGGATFCILGNITGTSQDIFPNSEGIGAIAKIVGCAHTTDNIRITAVDTHLFAGGTTTITMGADAITFTAGGAGKLSVARSAGSKTWEIAVTITWL